MWKVLVCEKRNHPEQRGTTSKDPEATLNKQKATKRQHQITKIFNCECTPEIKSNPKKQQKSKE